jgi:hypothetical protein
MKVNSHDLSMENSSRISLEAGEGNAARHNGAGK